MSEILQNKILTLKKNLIIETSGEFFINVGYEKTKVEQIAKKIGVGVGTIYSLFNSKEGLFVAWVYSIIESVFKELQEAFVFEKNNRKKLKIFISYKLKHYEKNKSILRDYMQNNSIFLKNMARGDSNPMKKIYSLICQMLEAIVKNNEAVFFTKDYMHLAYLLDNIINGYIEYFSQNNVNLESYTDEIYEMFFKLRVK